MEHPEGEADDGSLRVDFDRGYRLPELHRWAGHMGNDGEIGRAMGTEASKTAGDDTQLVPSDADHLSGVSPVGTSVKQVGLKDIFEKAEMICPTIAVCLPDIAEYIHDDPPIVKALKTGAYQARTAECRAIWIGKMPSGVTTVGYDFWMTYEDRVVIETIPHGLHGTDIVVPDISANLYEIGEECVPLCRFGHGTWGHWLGEILPMAALIERAFPGRFHYAVSWEHGLYNTRVEESLAAYGILENRIIKLSPDRSYRFSHAYRTTELWSSNSLHPMALDVMRGSIRIPTAIKSGDRVALQRSGSIGTGRTIGNINEIDRVLQERGFELVDIGSLTFMEQVGVFRSATNIFSVLGSALTGLIYASEGASVTTVRPHGWLDMFFYNLAQQRNARWVEIAGPTQGDNPFNSPFLVPVGVLKAILNKSS